MDFFNPSSFSESKLSMDHFREWATLVSNSYLSSGEDPSSSIAKIASDNDLTPPQIQTLVGESNKLIHQCKFASADDKYHAADFPLAETAKVLDKLQVDGGELKIASYMADPKIDNESNSFDPYEAFGVVDDGGHSKVAALKGEIKHSLEKLALLNQQIEDAIIVGEYAKESAEKNFIKTARAEILKNCFNQQDRMELLGQMSFFCKQAGLEKEAKIPLAKLSLVLGHEGLLDPGICKKASEYFMDKLADENAPEELISPNLKARVINGKHPLYISLKTFTDRCNALNKNLDRRNVIQDKVNITKQYARAL